MARTNTANKKVAFTHEGGRAFVHMTPMQALRRSVLSCFLWEDEFYEDGVKIADRIRDLAMQVAPSDLAALAIQARTQFKLRHAPLWLLVALAKSGSGTPLLGNAIPQVVKRADELAELVAMYWKANPATKKPNKQAPLSAQMKIGLARAFANFKEYHFAKYDRDGGVKLRDVLFLAHPKPSAERQELYKRLAERKLETPDTWETNLSGGKDKKETFERLIREKKLAALALLRNLRNMSEAGCDMALVKEAILTADYERVLPFRFVAAARAAPRFERELDMALLARLGEMPALRGETAVLVDVSGSMDVPLSGKSDLKRIDAAATLASIIPGSVRVFTFSNAVCECPPRKGMAGVDAIMRSQPHGGTQLFPAVALINRDIRYDRLIVITDEQAHASPYGGPSGLPDPLPGSRGYFINVASAKNGVGYGRWIHVDGFSENVLAFMRETEAV